MTDYLQTIANNQIDQDNQNDSCTSTGITAIHINTVYDDFIVWVEDGGCLELEMMNQHGLDTDIVTYKVTKRVRVN